MAFLDEHQLVVLGESSALLRVDLVIGDAVVMHHDWQHAAAPTHASAMASGQAVIFSGSSLLLQPADAVPEDSPGLQAWLRPRTQ